MPKPKANRYVAVADARDFAGHRIRLTFNDETVRVVDFGRFLAKAQNPDITDFRAIRKFKNFTVNDGNIVWGDYQMIIPVADLYRGEL